MRNKKDLSKGEIAEIKELYLGTWKSIRELSGIFETSTEVLRYLLDHQDHRKKQAEYSRKWRKENPEKTIEIERKSSKKWNAKNIEKVKENHRRYYRNKLKRS